MASLDDERLEITCPKCDKKFSATVRRLKGQGNRCPHCGAGMETKEFARDIKKTEKQLSDFQRDLGKMFR